MTSRGQQAARPEKIKVATYNIHGWIGTDHRQIPMRAIRVISELDADIVALQEANFSLEEGGHLDEAFFSTLTDMEVVLGPTFFKYSLHFGNALLSRFPITRFHRIDLSAHPYEPRGAIDAIIRIGDKTIRVLTAHLGLRAIERRFQADMLIRTLSGGFQGTVVVLGDFNEWTLRRAALRKLYSLFGKAKSPRTFPSIFPLLSLDRIMVSPPEALVEIRAHRSLDTIMASDHLPVTGIVEV
ncbi:MAG: Endonuclease/Exonuclease/phosphatase family protein [Deltaproteobacteria bacterium ADurb.BinA179]|jgi:endonuclease/exonuclease/phosphatase family metal-dependent hydrolase|nr:endonuclease/exonuclease/phosphatase family protein [Deltaproteobacteria bacterium]MDI9543797.1 endonuclease/exonuclease/phosphatase family protein [Pseudomonadota bacterium]NLW67948.1 endonuclease [Bacteriovoracaceae bacterium]OPZ26156.1 MAG: Endonuclease/Exonuclease/phosphatase family protein [Deltaproteobacteria bacterium ADurb.BinA179]HRR22664.1 endonuclease/exonuclease/phosphatase family protein [Desulfomonilia bacterium]